MALCFRPKKPGTLSNSRSAAALKRPLVLLLPVVAIAVQIAATKMAAAKTTDQRPENQVVSAFDIHTNPYKYENKLLWLDPGAVPVIVNGRVAQYSRGTYGASQIGFMGLRYDKMLDARRVLFDVLGMDMLRQRSDSALDTFGQIVVLIDNPNQVPLSLDRVWRVQPLGVIEGTNAFGASVKAPLIRFRGYKGEESAPTPAAARPAANSSSVVETPKKASYSKTIVTGSLIYMPKDGQAFLLRKGNLVLAFMDHGTWETLRNKIVDSVCVTLTGVFDSETQASVEKELRASGEKRDILAISNAHFVRWEQCQGDETGVGVPPREAKIIPTSPPRPGCKAYSPAVVALNGHLVSHTFAGPPGYSDVSKGDRPEVEWILNVTQPVCTNGSTVSQEYWQPAEKIWKPVVQKYPEIDGVSQLQLVITEQKDFDRYKALLNRDVTIRGSLSSAETGHHHTPLLLMVSAIQQQGPADEQ